jgi:hypothetical protein
MQTGSLKIAEVQVMQVLTKDEERSQGVALRTILLATDGSVHAHNALEAAADLARRSRASLHHGISTAAIRGVRGIRLRRSRGHDRPVRS